MKHRATDPFPTEVEIRRGRRRTVEVALERGRFVARVPARASGPSLDAMIDRLRESLWLRLRRESVFDDAALEDRAHAVAKCWFEPDRLPSFGVRFSRRQNKRWGSCTFDGRRGEIRISAHLMGHPTWVIDTVLHHEIAHLLVAGHGPEFQELVRSNPEHDRAQGYLEALEHTDRLGEIAPIRLQANLPTETVGEQADLFGRETG